MKAQEFHMLGRFLATQSYARRGGPLIEHGRRARWENFELGPYAARLGIVGDIVIHRPLSWHALVFEVDFGSHVVSAHCTPIRDEHGFRLGETMEWVHAPSDADLVALALLRTCNFG